HARGAPQPLAVGHAAFQAAGPVGATAHAVRADLDLVVGLRAATPGGGEPVTDLHALHGLDAHHRGGQPGVQPTVPVGEAAQAGREPVHHHLDHPAQSVALLAHQVDLFDHARAGLGVGTAHHVGV